MTKNSKNWKFISQANITCSFQRMLNKFLIVTQEVKTTGLKAEQWNLITWNPGDNSPGIHSSCSLKHLEKTATLASLLPQHMKHISLSGEAGGWPYTYRSVCCLRKSPVEFKEKLRQKNSGGGQKRRGKTSFYSF